jgi:pyruvate carboxylase subunit B
MRFLRWKYGLEEPPRETKPKTMADIKREDELLAKVKADIMAGKPAAADKPKETTPAEKETKEPGAIEPEVEGTAIKASMPGLIIRFDVKKGDKVKEGDNIVVMEAMKMAIDIVSPVDGIVKSVNFKEGDNIARDDILAIIE